MKIVQSCVGKFHHFDLARQFERQGCLKAIFTGYPRRKLTGEKLPSGKVHTFPWLHAPYMVMGRFMYGTPLHRDFAWINSMSFDRHVSRSALLADCDVFVGLSGTGLLSGRRVQQCGGRYICDRGSSHIRFQDAILRDEYSRWEMPYTGVDPRMIEQEEAEYATADMVTVASTFVRESFKSRGFPEEKLATIPYGVNLSQFHPVGEPAPETFDLLFVGGVTLRKGVPYLLEAFAKLKHPRKRLRIVGGHTTETRSFVSRLPTDGVEFLGHRPQDELIRLMSESHALVLPSIEDGFGLVMAQAMACGCALIASRNTGALDLFTDGVEGYIIEPRDSNALLEALGRMAEDREGLARMREAALRRVREIEGWTQYGDRFVEICEGLVARGGRN